MVETVELRKEFPDTKKGIVKAVDGVTIQAHPGKILGVLGVNGAGKTTFLRMLSTVIRPTSGTASVAGYDVSKDSERVRASIGFMSNSTALYGRLTGRETLDYFGGLYGLAGAQLKTRKEFVIETLKLHEFLDRLCDKLSTGQKQRISIARTILHDPPVLFFDEPTSGLDVVTSQTILEYIERTRDEGKTVIFCTHIMSEAERLCDNVVVIHNGVVCGEGAPKALIAEAEASSLEKAFLTLVQKAPAREAA
ncbi:MAG TPA: ATP-binding cassette domain-containing protein [Fimbriimonadaceae bacterium]|nr:ATP-binding cassette domain-containing protein [Fimbriimonadaceae bacterium]